MGFLTSALSAYEANPITTMGQNNVYPGVPRLCNNTITDDIVDGVFANCTSGGLVPKIPSP